MTLRTRLLLLVAAAALPVIAFACFVVATLWQEQRAAYAQAELGTVRALAIAVDSEVEGYVRALQGLAGDLETVEPGERFVAAARRELATQPSWTSIAVADLSGKPPRGIGRNVFEASGGFIDETLYTTVVATGRPASSGFRKLPGTATTIVQVGIPVLRGNAVTHVLAANVEAAYWARFLSGYPVPTAATVTLLDRNGTIIARTLNNERWSGKLASKGYLDAVARSPEEGTFPNVGLDGVPFQSAHRRTRAGWSLGIGIPLSEIESALLPPTLVMAGIGIAALALALLSALFLARRISRPVAALADAAQALARGEPAAALPRARGIAEVEEASRAYSEAARLLHERQDALNESLAREREARTQAEGANQAKDEFLAMLGHELRNPLHAITAAMAVIERVEPGSEHATRSREIVVRQARHLTHLVDDLLDVARVTSGKIVLDRALIDLGVVVQRSVAILQEAGRLKGHPVTLEIAPAWIPGDETRIEQIAVNLIENAGKYTPAGKAIRVRVAEEGSEAVFEVSDEGEGIAPDLLPRIFDLFIQGERTLDRAQGGLGLGLTLVRNLVELHGGRVSAHSEGVGRGARFVVRIPKAAAPQPAAATPKEFVREERALRVLVVEDNADSAETLRTLLALRGHDVQVAHDGPAAVERALSSRPDIALVDIGLPIFDGFEVARRLRAAPGGDAIRLVALTGYGQPEDRRAAGASGFDSFLVKPVEMAALLSVLALQ
ncbi:hypothetical protein BWI17_15220 [Betaproteobacteria bacterium GR16-43]|nr:hypothetical protein BWI17_15220 [Betaproteobacteria bacterium GR16-43]